jgi:hypothetical protein
LQSTQRGLSKIGEVVGDFVLLALLSDDTTVEVFHFWWTPQTVEVFQNKFILDGELLLQEIFQHKVG